jgi:hypothetical protein
LCGFGFEFHYTREGHHWRFKTPLHWRILNRHNQLGSDKLIDQCDIDVEVVAIDQFDIDVEVVVDQRQYKPINIYITKVPKKTLSIELRVALQ